MKYSFALAAAVSAVAAQDISQLSQCGQSCIADMVRIATSQFGCAQDDTACYCTNADFGYGVRDCSLEACGSDAQQVIEFGTNYCAAVVASVASGGATITASALSVLSSAAAGITEGGESAAESTPVTTSPLEATITTDGSTLVQTTGFVTLFGPAGAAGSASSAVSDAITSAESAASDAVSSAEGAASTAASDASDAAASATSAVSSAVSGASAAVSSALNSATSGSTGAAPMMTAAPMLAGAGIAALLFI